MATSLKTLDKVLKALFGLLFFFTPLIVIPINSELFEFGKMVFLYLITILIATCWVVKCILVKKVVIKPSPLNLPIILFLISQVISTYVSIDPVTSLFGYYSRFNGGLLSTLAYITLYFAFISNLSKKDAFKNLYFLLISSLLVSFYGILQHFGVDKNLWVQDVQNRVFSTLGQPNWLAAYLVVILPIALFLSLTKSKLWSVIFLLGYLTLLFSKSRSGIIAFSFSYFVFWAFNLKKHLKAFLISLIVIVVVTAFTGSPWTPKITEITRKNIIPPDTGTTQAFIPALESGGTESGTIRTIVWKGALDVFYNYPIFGSGVETFAYSFYLSRPSEHNLVSEWDYLYNKAHNEYLNFLATAGGVGLTTYLLLIAASLYQLVRPKNSLGLTLLAGYLSILITNFFGFSVVPVTLLFFLLPAFAFSINQNNEDEKINEIKIDKTQVVFLITILVISITLLTLVFRYWFADVAYNNGRALNSVRNYLSAKSELIKAIAYSPLQPTYYDELSKSLVGISLETLNENNANTVSQNIAKEALRAIIKAIAISPGNFHLLKSQASVYIKLAEINPEFIMYAITALEEAIKKSPTDAKLFYNLALLYEQTGDHAKALEIMQKTIDLKANYKEGRYAYAILLKRNGEINKAKEELNYILKYLAPNDYNTQKMLDTLPKISNQ